jgi:hypothetical protein
MRALTHGARIVLLAAVLGCSVDVRLGGRTRGSGAADASTSDLVDAARSEPDGGLDAAVGMELEPEPEDCRADELTGSSFCAAATWGGTLPGATSDLVIADGETVLLDCVAQVRTLTIAEGGVLRASHARSSRLTLHGNLIVRGRLEHGRPGCRIPTAVTAELVFAGMQDALYEGTPSALESSQDVPVDTAMVALDSDVGLWVLDRGVFTAAGALKRAWSFLTDGAGPGDAVIAVEDASGWSAGDLVALTPSAERSEREHFAQFDELAIAAVSGDGSTSVELVNAPVHTHAGCDRGTCLRRAEAINLSRNVVVRSADDSAHAHVMVAQRASLQLDSVELRWLGPEWPEDGPRCGGPRRRAPIWFHQQDDAADGSFVRHVAIWGGQSHFAVIERSHGIELRDVAGYDALGSGFELFYDAAGCASCERDFAPRVLLREVLAAKLGVALREQDCLRIVHRHTGIAVSGGEGSGCERCVATGIGYLGGGADVAGFSWQEGGSGRPAAFVFTDNVAHNNRNHGAFIWHNETRPQSPYARNAFWSNDGYGLYWGALGTALAFQDLTATDNGAASIGVAATPEDERLRVERASLDDLTVLGFAFPPERPAILRELSFGGAQPLAFSQPHAACSAGDESDPMDPDCTRIWLRIERPRFAPGVKPFDFGWTANRASLWEVRGFSHPDAEYRDLPADFDLHRRDNEVTGGALHAGFDAWLVPR